MKKSLLALAVLSAFAGAASAQSNVSIYGVADAGIFHTDNGAAKITGMGSGIQSGSRIGFRGTEDLGGGLSAIFTLESGFSLDDGALGQGIAANSGTPALTRLFGRQAFVGLNGGFGSVKLGRQNNPIRTALESVDPFALGMAGDAKNVFNVYGERADNTINYSTPALGGFSGQLAYSLGEIAGNNSAGRQLGMSAAYANGPVTAVLAYHKQNTLTGGSPTAFPSTPNGDANTILVGGTYNFGVAKLHAAYARNKGENAAGQTNLDRDDAMVGVSVPFGASTVMASYIRRSDDLNANRDANQMALGYTFDLSKRTNFYASYARVKNDGTANVGFGSSVSGTTAAGNDPSTFSVGIRHKF